MGLADMKRGLHDRLWNAQERWFALRAEGATKRALKLQGIREAGDPNLHTRNLIFAGATKRAVEETLKSFIEFAHDRFGIQRIEDLGKRECRAFIEDGIARGLAAGTLQARLSHLAKAGALIGKSASFAALTRRLAARLPESVEPPKRSTPSRETAERAIGILRAWDREYEVRTGRPRAYHLAARLQLETGARSISATDRLSQECLLEGNRVRLVGKGGRVVVAVIPADLHASLSDFIRRCGGPLAERRAYQTAWRRAVQTSGGRTTGTHGLRRRAAREFYSEAYSRSMARGLSPVEARRDARGEAVERLGHGRNRADQAACYLGPAA
jgi:hypothetical protein